MFASLAFHISFVFGGFCLLRSLQLSRQFQTNLHDCHHHHRKNRWFLKRKKMESNLWSNRLSTASSRRYHHQSRSGLFVLFYIKQKYWKKCCRTTPFDSFCCWNFDSCTDLFIGGGYDETDGDDDLNAMFLCPFCAEDFDIVGLCCHIDEDHPIEAKNGVKFWKYIYIYIFYPKL